MSQRISYRATRAARTSMISAAVVAALLLSACQDAVAPVPAPMPARPSLSATIAVSGPVDLGTISGGFDGVAWSVNNLQHVVGSNSTPGSLRAVLWTGPGVAIDLGLLPGGTLSNALAISDVTLPGGREYVAGGADVPCTAAECIFATTGHAFRWDAQNGMIDLGTLGGLWSTAFGVDQFGNVVGVSETRTASEGHAFIWSPSTGMRDLGSLSGQHYSAAYDLNGLFIAGTSYVRLPGGGEAVHAARWTPLGRWQDLGVLPGGHGSSGDAVNSVGWIAGTSENANGDLRAVLWKTQQPIDLGVLPGITVSLAEGVNDAGWVVGQSGKQGFVWTELDGMLALPALGSTYGTAAHDINGGTAVGNSELRPVMWILTPAP